MIIGGFIVLTGEGLLADLLRILLLTGPFYELRMFANYLEEIPNLFDDCKLMIRLYPHGWMKQQKDQVVRIKNIVKNVEISSLNLKDQIGWCDVALFSSTSAGIESMLSGRYTINVELHDLFKVDPIEGKGDFTKITRCTSPYDLKAELQRIRKLDDNAFEREISNQIDYAKKIYGPVNNDLIENFFFKPMSKSLPVN